jgi:hypothetical protein
VATITIVLVWAEQHILVAQHLVVTHKAAIFHTITKDMQHPEQVAQVVTFRDIEVQTEDREYV